MDEYLTSVPPPPAPETSPLSISHIRAKNPTDWKTVLGVGVGMVAIVVVGIGIGVVLESKLYQKPTVSVTASPSPSADPTANWKIYKYQQLFEIKIPNDLKIIDNGRIEIGDYLSIGMYPSNPEACRGDCTIIETKISKKINGLEVRYLTGWWGEIGGNIAQSYIEYIIPQNEKYIYLQMQELPFSTRTSLVREKVGKVSEVNSKLLDQILSTFKFLGQDYWVWGIQINTCCSCPTKIPVTQVGKDGWVSYKKGENYSSLLPKVCEGADCAPCPLLES